MTARVPVHPAVASVVASRRLGEGGGTRGTFTIARTRALLELRRAPQPTPWQWTVWLVRAANAVSASPQGIVEEQGEGERRVVRLVFTTPGADLEAVDLSDLLGGALLPDQGPPLGGASAAEGTERFRRLVARAINQALADETLDELELRLPGAGLGFVRDEGAAADVDPFRRTGADPGPAQSFCVILRRSRAPLGQRLGAWLTGRTALAGLLADLWRKAIVGADTENDPGQGMSLAPLATGRRVELGDHAVVTLAQDAQSAWLVRDGVRIATLDAGLGRAGLPVRALAGWYECPGLRSTADERGIAEDRGFELLVAWLHDLRAHTFDVPDAPGTTRVEWPTVLSAVPTASGYTLSLAALAARVEQDRDLVWVWPHRLASVPPALRARVLQLWPSELALLQRSLAAGRFIPLEAFGSDPEAQRADLGALQQGCFPPLSLAVGARVQAPEGPAVGVDLSAFVHRFPTATAGAVVVLAYEREVAHVRDARRVFPGLTLVARLRPLEEALDLSTLRAATEVIDAVVEHARAAAQAHFEALLAHAGQAVAVWDVPLVRAALERLSALRIGLRYVIENGALRLTWEDGVLLGLPVARGPGGEVFTLRDLLHRCRDVGFCVAAHASQRWSSLESREPGLEPLRLDEPARVAFDRVLSGAALLTMPVVAEAHPRVRPAAEQVALCLDREAAARDLSRAGSDPLARLRLAAHLCVARATGRDELGLDGVALFSRYDPRAASPVRLVSLRAIEEEDPPPALSFPGAVGRDLPGPAIEALPGLAALLHEVVGLPPEATPRAGLSLVDAQRAGPIRKRARQVAPLVSRPVVHAVGVGSLRIAGDGDSTGVELWSRGLRVGEVHLPEPLGRVSGRLWLARNAPHAEIEAAVRGLARDVLAALVEERNLVPEGSRREKLDAVVEYARERVARADPLGLRGVLGVETPAVAPHAFLERSIRAWPLRRLPRRPEAWLLDIVVQCIGFRVAVDTAFLSWSAAKVERITADGTVALELGRRNPWIQRALEAGAQDRVAAFEAAALVIAEFFAQVRERRLLSPRPVDEAVAYCRLLALLFEHVR